MSAGLWLHASNTQSSMVSVVCPTRSRAFHALLHQLTHILASKTLNLNIHTPDNVTLGAWFTFAEPAFQSLRSARRPLPNPDLQDIYFALSRYKTVIFLHGNGGSRAAPFRRQFYASWSSKLAVNVLAIDYRGYGDSGGAPSEEGLAIDGRAAWDWVIANGARPDNIVLVGQSLGTGVAAKVAHQLSREGRISFFWTRTVVDRFR